MRTTTLHTKADNSTTSSRTDLIVRRRPAGSGVDSVAGPRLRSLRVATGLRWGIFQGSHHLCDGATIIYGVMVASESELMADFVRSHAAAFPGSSQAQERPWSTAIQLFNGRDGTHGRPGDRYDSYFFTTVNHSDFDPDWPIATDWPAVIRGLRGSLRLTQADFAHACDLGRATVERWESGRTTPFAGNALELLTLVRRRLETPVQAGQALNLAASVVLPHITRPTAEYSGSQIAGLLKTGKHDHTDLGPALLAALTSARILVATEPGGDELEDTYFPLAARLRGLAPLPEWAQGLIENLQHVSESDRALVIGMAQRFARGA